MKIVEFYQRRELDITVLVSLPAYSPADHPRPPDVLYRVLNPGRASLSDAAALDFE